MTIRRVEGTRPGGPAPQPVLTALLAVLLGSMWAAAAEPTVDEWERADPERSVRVFDFDEPDNLGTIPKYWDLFPGESFPNYAGGWFDRSTGKTAPPSFYLDMNGRNVAFRYRGIETPIRPNSDYLVVGWVRPNHLTTSRATITAYYLDHEGKPLRDTQRQGRLVGGEDAGEGWHRVEVYLPAGPFEAVALGLTLWVEQAAVWDPTPRPDRHIERADIRAGAWFDDILVYRLPRVTLSTTAQGNIFITPQVAALETMVLEYDGTGLSAELEVVNAEGDVVERRPIPVQTSRHRVELPHLGPGHYRAQLKVSSGAHTLVDRWLGFAVLGQIRAGPHYASHAFGVVLNGAQRDGSDAEVALMAAMGLGAVKIPLWTGSMTTPGFIEDPESLEVLLDGLMRLRVDSTGVLAGLPPELARTANEYKRSLIDVLNDPVESWRGFLGPAVAPYASVLGSWQVGADGDASVAEDPRLAETLASVRREILMMTTSPHLTVPVSVDMDLQGHPLTADRITLAIPSGIHPEYIGEYLQAYGGLGYMRVEAYVAPSPQPYQRAARLGRWAASIVETRHAGADTVYVPQLWWRRQTVDGPSVEPTEEFIVYRTIATLLREARPDGALVTEEGTRALIFSQGARSVLAVWDRRAPPEGRTWEVQLGEATRAVDLWGRSKALERTADGLHRVTLTSMPLFVDGIERWVPAFQRDLHLLPESVAFSLASHEHGMRIANPSGRVLTGKLSLDVPETWHARPRHIHFSIPEGGESTFPLALRYSHNEPAGSKVLFADVQLSGAEAYRMRVPLRFELGIEDVDVWGFATTEGDQVVIRHGVRNRSDEVLSFRAYAAAPGRDRQHKVIIGLAPGESRLREYAFANVEELLGRTVRVSLREVRGPRMHNLELVVH